MPNDNDVTPTSVGQRFERPLTRQDLGRAMDQAWNEWTSDTGDVPDSFSVHGPRTTRVSARFEHSQWADNVLAWLESGGYEVVRRTRVND